MLPVLRNRFEEQKENVLKLIERYEQEYRLSWNDIGIFGSYARNEATGCSDIDFCIIGAKPDPQISGSLREDAEMYNADVIFISKDEFLHGDSLLSKNLRRDIIFVRGGFDYEK